MIGLQCARLRAALVDFADGSLEEPERASMERHVSRCADCADTVLALREVPDELARRVRPAPDERFFSEQRRRIGEAIDRGVIVDVRSRPTRRPRPAAWWRLAPALAAAAALFLVLERSPTTAPEPSAQTSAAVPAQHARSGESLAAFVEEPSPLTSVDVTSVDESSLASLDESLEDSFAGYSDGHLI